MKLLGLVALAIAYCKAQQFVQLSQENISKLVPIAIQCVGENGVDPSILTQIISMKFGSDETTQKFFFCTFRKGGYANKKGHVRVNKALELYPENVDKEAIKKVMEECNKEEGKNPTETTFKFLKCFLAKTPVLFIL